MKTLIRISLLFISVSLCACAADMGDLDRTQPGKLKKSVFNHEWYYRQTVIGVPFTTGITFIGEQSILERIRWEISEDFLTAYRSYERVADSEAPSQLPGMPYQGAPIAAFRIVNHFDVARTYNEATGEQTNVIVENGVDRPWYDRSYIRVDWSQNLLANFDFMAGGHEGLGVRTQSASYTVTDPNHPDAPVFGINTKNKWVDSRDPFEWGELDSVDYFDITQKLQVSPDVFPLYYDDGSVDYWPACWFYEYGPWDCASQTIKVRASFLKVKPSSYEPLPYPDNYVARDKNGNDIRTMWDAEAEEYRRCESHESADCNQVRIPMFDLFGYFRRERESYNRDYGLTESGRIYYADRFNIWETSLDSQNNPLPYEQRKVKKITYHLSEGFPAELTAAAMKVGSWWNDAFESTVQSLQGHTNDTAVFEIVPNTYSVSDGKIKDFGQRNGDLRYSHLYWVDNPQFESLLGYGPSSVDPLTGEIISADAYVYGAAIDTYAAYGVEVIELARGDIHERDFIEGENVAFAIQEMRQNETPAPDNLRREIEEIMNKGLSNRLDTIRERGPRAYRTSFDETQARLRQAEAAGIGDALWNSEMRETLERRFGRKLELTEFASGRLVKAYRKHRMNLAKKRLDFRDFDDAGVLALMDEFEGLSREEILLRLRSYLFKSVAAHEIGHTVGLRHNFSGSTDALNYHDKYWEIRQSEASTLDLPSQSEMREGLREYSYSSIMDYGARFNSDIRGIGKYDHAAIKFGYGQLVEQFTNPPDWNEQDILRFYNLDDAIGDDWVHYTDLPRLFSTSTQPASGVANMKNRQDIPMQAMIDWLTLEPGATDLTDSLVPYRFCSDEYVGAQWDCDVWDEGADPYEMNSYRAQYYNDYYIFDAFKRNRRYLDPFEYYYSLYYRVMEPMATQYHLWLYDQWYKAGEWEWLHDQATNATSTADWNLDPHGGLSGTAAAMQALNFFTNVIGTPEPGSYYRDPTTDRLNWWTYDEDTPCEDGQDSLNDACSDLYIPLAQGRYAYTEFDDVSGYYWYERVRVVGAFWDKLAALEVISNPSTYLLGVDDIADYTTYNLGFNVAFPHAVGTIFGAIINDDYQHFAHTLQSDGTVVSPKLFETVTASQSDSPTPSTSGKIIDPATNFTISLYSMFYGMALLNSNFDQSFNDNAKIWLEGHGEALDLSSNSNIATFENPYNLRRYQAVESPNQKHYSLGFQMLTRANDLKTTIEATGEDCFFSDARSCDEASAAKWELRNLIENIEVVRGYYDVFGYALF